MLLGCSFHVTVTTTLIRRQQDIFESQHQCRMPSQQWRRILCGEIVKCGKGAVFHRGIRIVQSRIGQDIQQVSILVAAEEDLDATRSGCDIAQCSRGVTTSRNENFLHGATLRNVR